MNLSTAFSQALFNLIQNPMRSLLMAMTLGAGSTAACLATAILDGFGVEVERMAFGAYARSVVVTENLMFPDRFGPPRLSDVDNLVTALGDELEGAAVWRRARALAVNRAQRVELDVYGLQGDYRFEVDMGLARGRFFTPEELKSADRVCMLGSRTASRIFELTSDPIEQTVRLNGVGCRVVGVFEPARTRTSEQFGDAIFAPFDAVGRYFELTPVLSPIEVSQITLIFYDRDTARLSRSQIEQILRRAHGAPLSQASPFSFADPAAPTRAVVRQRELLQSLLWSVATVTLVGAAISYAGFTSTTVAMRRRDIALQISAGAMRRDILIQYWLESMMVGTLGGTLGLVAGLVSARGLGMLADVPIAIEPSFALVAFVSGVGAGTLAGLWPAFRAASAPPALAARQ